MEATGFRQGVSPSTALSLSSSGLWATMLSLLAGLIASGGGGVLVTSLQTVLVWLLLLTAILLIRPQLAWQSTFAGVVAITAILLLPVIAHVGWIQLPVLVVAVLGYLAWAERGPTRQLLLAASTTILCLTLFRILRMQVPAIWLGTDWLGGLMGLAVAPISGRGISLGASFAGVDTLAVAVLFLCIASAYLRPCRKRTVVAAIGVLFVVHLCYLTLLAHTPHLLERMPQAQQPPQGGPYSPPPFCWSTVGHQLLPWNLPAAAAIAHCAALGIIIRWLPWQATESSPLPPTPLASAHARRATSVLVLCAVLLAFMSGLTGGGTDLTDKQFLANDEATIDYAVPVHDEYGQLSSGMFGLLPSFVGSLNGNFRTAAQVTAKELESIDVLMLLHATEDFAASDVIWNFVRQGGSLLVVTDGFAPEITEDRFLIDLLRQSAIQVQSDAATSATGDWQESLQLCLHSSTSTAGLPANRFAVDYGASLELTWGAAPLVIGRWGWSAPQQGASWEESRPLLTGAKLGDLVLAAEQRIGKGRVVVLGSNQAVMNEGLVHSYSFMGNLLSSLAHDRAGPRAVWRQALSLLCAAGLVTLLVLRRPPPGTLLAIAVALCAAFIGSRAWSESASVVLPSSVGEPRSADAATPRRIAYIDQSHLEAFDVTQWSFDATNGLILNLMRNGFLPFMLPELTTERLTDASLLVSIAPARSFSGDERKAVVQFVESGGMFISMVGAEEASASESILAEFGLHVPPSPLPADATTVETEPLGRTQPLYQVDSSDTESYQASLRMYAAWPVESSDEEYVVIAEGSNQLRVIDSDTQYPVAIAKPWGKGFVVLIGDSSFALNKNLEYLGGEPFQGQHENAQFWRWLLSALSGQSAYTPPPYSAAETSAGEDE